MTAELVIADIRPAAPILRRELAGGAVADR
jgi:hypothetical protein